MPLAKKTLRERFLSGSFWVLWSRVVTTLSSLASQALLARLLPLNEYGSFLLLSSLVATAGTVASMGLRPTLVREVSKHMAQKRPGEARRAVFLGLFWGTFGSLAAALILNLGLGTWLSRHLLKEPALASLMLIVGIWIVASTVQSLASEAYRGFQDILRASLYGGPVSGLLLIAVLVPAVSQEAPFSLEVAVGLACLTAILGALFPLPFLFRSLLRLKGKAKTRSSDFLKQAWPVLAANVAGFLVSQADLWCLGATRSKEEVAYYGAGARLAVFVSMSLMIVNGVLPPMIAELHAKGEKERLQRALRRVAGYSSWSALAVYGFMFFGGAWLLRHTYGSEGFVQAWPVLAWLGLGQLANVLTGSCGFTLLMTGHQKAFMALTLAVGSASVVAMILLAPAYGMLGVAPAAALGTALLNVVLWLYARWKLGLWTQASWLPPYNHPSHAQR